MGDEEFNEGELKLIREAGQGTARKVAAPRSLAQESTDTDGILRNQFSGQQSFRAVRKQNRQLLRACSLLRDEVSRLNESLKLASRLANYDELTGLANRRLLLERFRLASALGKRHRQQLALLFLDLDDFKHINDQQGHEVGDKILQQVAARLSSCIRASDTACRYGGDEFVVLLAEIDNRNGASTEVKRVLAHLAAPYVVGGKSIRMTVSIGVAIYPDDGVDYIDLIRHSDFSMFRNKSNGAHRTPADAATQNVQT